MENLVRTTMLNNLLEFQGKKILVTGHTGFKGTWLSRTLVLAGAEVHGIALAAENSSLYSRISDLGIHSSTLLDIRNRSAVEDYFNGMTFDGVFHLAAQPLVLKSYEQPVETFETNVMGTVHLLNSIIKNSASNWVVLITTDKVYQNFETTKGYKETDALGGKDPYSASKSSAEMAISAWRTIAEFNGSKVKLCSARAGNVIGGGDRSENRLIPDLVRSFSANRPATIRNPNSLRPWQHVLDPISGYLAIGKFYSQGKKVAYSYNFGPGIESKLSVHDVAKIASSVWGEFASLQLEIDNDKPPESELLWLSSTAAFKDLAWKNKLNALEAIQWTIDMEKLLTANNPKVTLDKQIINFFMGDI
jgi:CDP-glucose 4,6-dehydratase